MVSHEIWINMHSWVFQRLQIALVLCTRAILRSLKTHLCMLYPNFTRNLNRLCWGNLAMQVIYRWNVVKRSCGTLVMLLNENGPLGSFFRTALQIGVVDIPPSGSSPNLYKHWVSSEYVVEGLPLFNTSINWRSPSDKLMSPPSMFRHQIICHTVLLPYFWNSGSCHSQLVCYISKSAKENVFIYLFI
jgi:hypothetical protein